jgi:crotonobetainyl-CoA:carnitine CoA-transferase CaiB-like acyl-CoA transferase
MAPNGLLTGVRILDFTIWRPGPYATQLLGELGAEVCKVEPPGGDPMRAYPGLFEALSVNKRSIVLDLKTDAGRGRALELATDADVVIEGFRPGVAARLGIGYDDVRGVNARVVYCSVSGMGQLGELSSAPGHDINFQAWSGALAPDGGTPVVAAVPIADLAGGMAAAYAVCAAIVNRLRTGTGERIDVAMGDVLATWTGAVAPAARGVDPSARGVPGYGLFQAADGGWITLGIITEDHFWAALCDVLALADAREMQFVDRMTHIEPLQTRIAAAIARHPRDEVVDALLAAGIPVAPLLDRAEMLRLSHFREREVVTFDAWSTSPATGHPVRFEHHPAARTSRAPTLDEHSGMGFRPRP